MLVLEWITRVVSVAAGAFLGTFVGRTTEPVLLPVDEDVYEAYGWSEVPGELGWRGCSR